MTCPNCERLEAELKKERELKEHFQRAHFALDKAHDQALQMLREILNEWVCVTASDISLRIKAQEFLAKVGKS